MRKGLFIFLLIISCQKSYSQDQKTVFVELLGNGIIIGSINYEHRFNKLMDGLAIRVGISYADHRNKLYTFPLMLNYLIGGPKHHLEVGGGVVILSKAIDFGGSNRLSGTNPTAALMYRYESPKNGFSFRIGYTPIYAKENPIYLWLGMGLGYRFPH